MSPTGKWWDLLQLDNFWQARLRRGRQGTRGLHVLKARSLTGSSIRGSEWRLHRHWDHHSAMGDLLGEDFALADGHTLSRR